MPVQHANPTSSLVNINGTQNEKYFVNSFFILSISVRFIYYVLFNRNKNDTLWTLVYTAILLNEFEQNSK